MYLEYWQLSAKPFPYRMPATDCFPVASQQSGLLRLQYCIENSAGCALLLGESGLGKTTVTQQLKASSLQLRPFCCLAFPGLSAVEQLRMICGQLSDAPYAGSGPADALLLDISHNLRRAAGQGNHPVLCFDDAQLLSPDVMTDVILPLLNLRDLDESTDFSVVLAGQPGLLPQLSRHPQLRERIAVTARLSGLAESETADYVANRLTACGGSAGIFEPEAVQRLQEISQGNPRRINRLCDMALLVGCAEQRGTIAAAQIDAVGTELLKAA